MKTIILAIAVAIAALTAQAQASDVSASMARVEARFGATFDAATARSEAAVETNQHSIGFAGGKSVTVMNHKVSVDALKTIGTAVWKQKVSIKVNF